MSKYTAKQIAVAWETINEFGDKPFESLGDMEQAALITAYDIIRNSNEQ